MSKDSKGIELGKGISQRADGRFIARFTSNTGKRKTLYNFKLNKLKRKLREAVIVFYILDNCMDWITYLWERKVLYG